MGRSNREIGELTSSEEQKADEPLRLFDQVEIPSYKSVEEERNRLNLRQDFTRTFGKALFILVAIAAVAILTITLLFPILVVSGESMEPTLEQDDVVVMMKPGGFKTGDLVGFYYQNKLLIKRVIAGPGDWVNITGDGSVYINNELLNEPYVVEQSLGQTDLTYPYQVSENHYFVMGDHRATSIDSRSSVIGSVDADQIAGKIMFRVWPLNKFGLVK